MAYIIGIGLGLLVMVFATVVGFDRDRGFYPVVLIVTASYYLLFALGSGPAMGLELLALGLFAIVAVIGHRAGLWIVAVALLGHAGFDLVHVRLIANPGLPAEWPSFCMAFDVTAALYLAGRLAVTNFRGCDVAPWRAVTSASSSPRHPWPPGARLQ